jgi:nucleoside phosphorylase
MSMSNASENALMLLLFNNAAWANVGNAGGLQPSSAAGSFFVALHSADPDETGNQSTSEVAYTGYARVGVARSGAGFTVTASSIANTAAVTFGACTAGTATATHFSVGLLSSGAGQILYSGALDTPRVISSGVTPEFPIGALTGTAD